PGITVTLRQHDDVVAPQVGGLDVLLVQLAVADAEPLVDEVPKSTDVIGRGRAAREQRDAGRLEQPEVAAAEVRVIALSPARRDGDGAGADIVCSAVDGRGDVTTALIRGQREDRAP